MILAVINGGLGLQLANNTKAGKIVYGVLVGVVACLYVAFVLSKRKTQAPFGSGRKEKASETRLTEIEMESPRATS
jgi:hypothetical protein